MITLFSAISTDSFLPECLVQLRGMQHGDHEHFDLCHVVISMFINAISNCCLPGCAVNVSILALFLQLCPSSSQTLLKFWCSFWFFATLTCVSKAIFVEHNITSNDYFPTLLIKQSVAFRCCTISNKPVLLSFLVQLPCLLFWNVCDTQCTQTFSNDPSPVSCCTISHTGLFSTSTLMLVLDS